MLLHLGTDANGVPLGMESYFTIIKVKEATPGVRRFEPTKKCEISEMPTNQYCISEGDNHAPALLSILLVALPVRRRSVQP